MVLSSDVFKEPLDETCYAILFFAKESTQSSGDVFVVPGISPEAIP
jgi:hypothetical protein